MKDTLWQCCSPGTALVGNYDKYAFIEAVGSILMSENKWTQNISRIISRWFYFGDLLSKRFQFHGQQ